MKPDGSSSKTARETGRFRNRLSECAPLLVCALLLALSAARPDLDLVRSAMGKSRLGGEMRHVDTGGYYEQLIDEGRLSRPEAVADDRPPPDWVPFGASGIVEPVPSYLRWRMKADLDMTWNGEAFHTNSQGYRTPETTLEKPDDVYRILVFGSSNTMGHGVADHEPYPRLLESWFQGLPALGRRVEVVNLAVSGESPSRRLVRMWREARRYNPDWVLCDVSFLDPSLEERHLEALIRGEPAPTIPLAYVAAALERSKVSPDDSSEEFLRKIRFELRALLDGAFGGWADFSRTTGIPLTLVLLPRADEKQDNPAMLSLMYRYVRRHDVDFLDLSGAFGERAIEEVRISPWDKHPSVKGHRLIFKALRDELVDRGSLPGLSLPVDADL